MDHSMSSYHSHLAQISTGQRESEYRLPAQTADLIQDTLRPSYNPYPFVNWAESRSALVSQSMCSQDLGYSNPWGATMSGFGEHQLHPNQMRGLQPEPVYTYQTPSSSFSMASAPVMEPLSPRMVKSDPGMPFHQGHQLSPQWTSHEQNLNYQSMELEQAMKLENPVGMIHSIPTAPPSPISITSHHSSHSSDGVHSNPISIMADSSSPRTISGDSEEDHPIDPPYSQLIYQALKESKDHRLQLQDIYAWFEQNTNKCKDQGKGWQNSIRHNLSMNAGFEAIKTDVPGGKRAVNYWSLTAQAISKGRVESTTRYRRPNSRKSPNSDNAALQGVCQSQRGVKVQKGWDETRLKHQKHRPTKSPSQYGVQGEAQPFQMSPMSTSEMRYACPFGYDKVNGCTPSSHGNSPIFCEGLEPASSWGPVGMENYEWYGPNNGAVTGSGSEDQLTMHGFSVKEERWG
ncbi:transcriptional regulator family: Forkhead [Penicillium longicatenatum]|uniref:transcriptional regulator family: Forkhead n=1 Tax=Penicillium longicatenatum TaxID=1561947 RepID=UPI0025496CC7|nr:transcriptional regulator family: Forkhead [Penicillium longicatenatum]KAJ5661056.1 transcriptional regulator family: Forkhead [Penicillium longicatenatum]